MTRWFKYTFPPACVLPLLALPFFAPSAIAASRVLPTAQEFDVDVDFVNGAPTRALGANVGSIEEHNTDIRYVLSPQITKFLLLRLGAEYQRTSFHVQSNAPLPEELHQASVIIGLDCQLTDQWLLRAELQPGIYSDLEDVSWRDVNAPFLLTVACIANADFQWFAGLYVNVYSRYPVWPALGMRWKFADQWTLNLLLPHPRLEYDLNERLKLYVGGRIKAGTFRVGDDFGTDHSLPQLDHALLDQYELRVGPGVSWKLRANLTIELDAGYMVYRELNFHDEHVVLRSDPAPYVQVAWHARF